MKKIQSLIKNLFVCLIIFQSAAAQTGPKQDCTIAPSFIAHTGLSVSSVKSGKPFTLSLSVPGPSTCDYAVTIQTSQNLVYVPTASYPLPLTNTSATPPIYSVIMPGSGISNPDYTFKFKPGETCNGDIGTFKIKIKRICGTTADSCEMNLQLTAEAQNYWSVKKEHVWGDMKGGMHVWRIRLEQAPHIWGEGDYNIYAGTIKDVITTGPSTMITGVSGVTATGLGTSIATWSTGTISSYNSFVDYYVYSTSCESIGTVIKNCVNYDFCLGTEIPIIIRTPQVKIISSGGNSGPSLPRVSCCDKLTGFDCATFPLKGSDLATTPLVKTHLFSTTSNYTTGCEGVYQITISNSANVPITNLELTDNFPAGITATSISIAGVPIFGSTPALGYDLFVPSTGVLYYSGNTSSSYAPSPFTFSFAGFKIKTTSGNLTLGSIVITIKFKITASVGTTIKNCAKLSYNGDFSATSSNCSITVPPVTSNTVQSCDEFTVQSPKAIPFITKCIIGTNSFQIGDVIPFRIVIANHGAAGFYGNLNDLLSSPQNLEFVAGSDTYSWGVSPFDPYSAPNITCNPSVPNTGMPSFVTADFSSVQNPKWSISNMPGNCDLDKANYLVINFKAKIKPTTWGPYYNTATLSFIGGGPITGTAGYNIIAIGDIKPVKLVNNGPGNTFSSSTAFVDPGNPFQFSLRFLNSGSVNIKTLSLTDAMPSCALAVSIASCTVYPGDGSAAYTITVSGVLPNLALPIGFILKPGDLAEVIVNATAASNYTVQCCNNGFKVQGVNALSLITIENQSAEACIKPLNCCSIKNVSVNISPVASSVNGWLNLNVNITSGPLPMQEVTIAIVDYHVEYSYPECKPLNIGNGVTNMQSLVPAGTAFNIGGTGGLLQSSPQQYPLNIQNHISWNLGNPVSFTNGRSIPIRILRPDMLNIPCCNGIFYYCLKITFKDVNCNTCEKIICSSAPLYKPRTRGNNSLDVQRRLYMPTQKGKTENAEFCEGCNINEKDNIEIQQEHR